MSFAHPLALAGLVIVPLLAWLWLVQDRRRSRAASAFTNLALLPNLVERAPGRLRFVPPALFLVALASHASANLAQGVWDRFFHRQDVRLLRAGLRALEGEVARAPATVDVLVEAQDVLDQVATTAFSRHPRTDSNELGARARVAARRGDVDGAVALARKGVGVITGLESPQAEGRARELLGMLLLENGDEEGALAELQRAHELYAMKAYRPGERRVADVLEARRTRAES